jgi:hypothetical protein
MRRPRPSNGVRPNNGVSARKHEPSIFNAEGNPYIGGYMLFGKPFFGYVSAIFSVLSLCCRFLLLAPDFVLSTATGWA